MLAAQSLHIPEPRMRERLILQEIARLLLSR